MLCQLYVGLILFGIPCFCCSFHPTKLGEGISLKGYLRKTHGRSSVLFLSCYMLNDYVCIIIEMMRCTPAFTSARAIMSECAHYPYQ